MTEKRRTAARASSRKAAPRRPARASKREPIAPPSRVARHSLYRSMILVAAERAFAKHGYAKTRMIDVANEAGLAIATVYTTIPGKEALYAAIHEQRGRALLDLASNAAKTYTTAREALLHGLETYATFLADHPDYLRIHLNEAQPWALDPRFLCEEQKRQWQQGLDLTTLVFRAAQAEGAVIDGDPELMARLMIAAHQVLLVRWVEEGMKRPVADLVAQMKDHVERAFFAASRGGAVSGEGAPGRAP